MKAHPAYSPKLGGGCRRQGESRDIWRSRPYRVKIGSRTISVRGEPSRSRPIGWRNPLPIESPHTKG